jgi:hypothetical protein
MRIDPKGNVGGYPALLVRKLVRRLNNLLNWDWETVQGVLLVGPSEARAAVKALERVGFAKANRGRGPKTWTTTQLGQSFGSATAARPITRRAAEEALALFLARVDRVNSDDYFLAKVNHAELISVCHRLGVSSQCGRCGEPGWHLLIATIRNWGISSI